MKNRFLQKAVALLVALTAGLASAQPSPGFSKQAPLVGTGTVGDKLRITPCPSGQLYVSDGTAWSCASGGGSTTPDSVSNVGNLTAYYRYDNWAPTGLTTNGTIVFTASDDSGSYLTGLSSTGMSLGSRRKLCNVDSKNDDGVAMLVNQSTNSSAANRFLTPGSGDVHTHRSDFIIGQNSCAEVTYLAADQEDPTFRAWVVTGQSRFAAVVTRQLQFYGSYYATAITGTTNDYVPSPVPQYTCNPGSYACNEAGNNGNAEDSSLILLQTVDTTGATLTGLNYTSGTPSSNGPIKILFNLGPGNITLKNSTTSTTINQFQFAPAGSEYDVVLKPNRTPVLLWHERDSGRWVAIGHSDNVFDAKLVTALEGISVKRGSSTYSIDMQSSTSASTTPEHFVHILDGDTYDTTSGALNVYGVSSTLSGTRSAGANSVNKFAIYGSSSSGTGIAGWSGYFDLGAFHVGGAADFGSTLSVAGNATIGDTTADSHTLWGSSLFQNAASTDVTIERHGGGPGLHFKSSGGTIGSPTFSPGTGGVLGQIRVTGYGASAYQGSYPAYQVNPSQDWTNTANGTNHQWYVVGNGTQTANVAMELLQDKSLHLIGAGQFDSTFNATGAITENTVRVVSVAGSGLTKSGATLTLNMTALSCSAGQHINSVTAIGGFTCTADAGITNSAGNNVVTKSNGTNLVASSVTDDGTTWSLNTNKVQITESTGATAIAGNVSIGSNWTTNATSGDMVTGNVRAGNATYLDATNSTLTCAYLSDSDQDCTFGGTSYAGGTTRFRNFVFKDGKNATVATFTGSTKALSLVGPATLNGDVTLGDASADAIAITGTPTFNADIKTADNVKIATKGSGSVSLSAGCGTGATVSGDRSWGTVTTQATGLGTCVITFGTAFTNTPTCITSADSTTKGYSQAEATGSLTLGTLVVTKYHWNCVDHY